MATSQNGWSASPNLSIRPLIVAGESFSPGIRDDDNVYAVLQYVAEQLNKRVEPIVAAGWHQADDWGFYYRANANDPNSLSNHSSGTAIDYNATRHPNGVPTSHTFTSRQASEVHKILAEVDNVVRWGGDYTGAPDAMHFEINAGAAAVAKAARKIAERPKATIKVATFNTHVGQRGLKLRRNLRRMWKAAGYPDVIALQEAHGLKRGFWRYRRYAADSFPRREATNNVLLVRRDVLFIRKRLLAVDAPDWIGPKPPREHPATHPARVFFGACVEVDGKRWEVLSIHRATSSHGKNKATRAAEAEQLVAWVRDRRHRRPNRPVIPVGDWNGKPIDIALNVGSWMAMQGIDGAVPVGARALSVVKLEGKYGSDHHPVVINLEEN